MTADRVKTLRRIEAVQEQMARLAEVRLVAAEQALRQAIEDNERLEAYLATEGALGIPLARAALSCLHMRARHLQAAEDSVKEREAARSAARRRERAIEGAREKAELTARRAEEDRVLREITEVWLAASSASPR